MNKILKKQVDVLPSKSQALCKLTTVIQCIAIALNDVMSKACEERLMTIRTYVAMHTNLILLFKPTLYSSTLVIKVEILTITL